MVKKATKKKILNFSKKVGTYSFNVGKGLMKESANFLRGMEIAAQKKTSGVKVGDIVTITKGEYIGKRMLVSGFVEGGVIGNSGGNIVKIRHGSYRR